MAVGITLRDDLVEVWRIQRVHAVMPVVAAEAAARQLVLHDVKEVAEAAKQFYFAVAEQIIGRAQAWCNLLAPPETDSLETGQSLIGRKVFLIQAHAQVQREPPSNSPRILNVESVVHTAHLPGGAQIAEVDRAEIALASAAVGSAAGLSVARLILGNNRFAAGNAVRCERTVLDVVPNVHIRSVVAVEHVVSATVKGVPKLEVVGSEATLEVRQILAKTVPVKHVEERLGVRSDIGKTCGIHELRRQQSPVQCLSTCWRRSISGGIGIVGIAVNVPDTARYATVLIILVEIAVPGGRDQVGRETDICAHVVDYVWRDVADSTVEVIGVCSRGRVELPESIVRPRQRGASAALILVCPGSEQTDLLRCKVIHPGDRIVSVNIIVESSCTWSARRGREVYRARGLVILRRSGTEHP